MNKKTRAISILVCICIFAFSCTPPKNKYYKEPVSFSFGNYTEKSFVNDFFGFEIGIASKWHRMTEDDIDYITSLSLDFLANKGEEAFDNLTTKDVRNAFLFGIMSNETMKDTAGAFGSNIMVTAENLHALRPHEKTAAKYIDFLKEFLLTAEELEYEFIGDVENIDINGKELLQLNIYAAKYNVNQSVFVVVEKGFALMFCLSYFSDSDYDDLFQVLSTLQFNESGE